MTHIQDRILLEDSPSGESFVMPIAITGTASMIMLSFGRLLVASNRPENQGASLNERVGTSFDRMLSACFKVSICSAMVLEKVIDWDCETPPWAVFQYDYLDMEESNCLSQHLLDSIADEDWLEMAENTSWPSLDLSDSKVLEDLVVGWAKRRKLPLVETPTTTQYILNIAKYWGLTVEVRKHYIGQFATVYIVAPQGMSKEAQRELLNKFCEQMTLCPDPVVRELRPVRTRFDNPPRFMKHTGKIDPGHPRHGDPLIEIDSFIWEGE